MGKHNQDFPQEQGNVILYTTDDGRAKVSLMSRDGRIWLNQKQMSELFAVTKMNISLHIANILKEGELDESVVKSYFTTASDGKTYKVVYYALEMILAVGFRVRGIRGTQFRQWPQADTFREFSCAAEGPLRVWARAAGPRFSFRGRASSALCASCGAAF